MCPKVSCEGTYAGCAQIFPLAVIGELNHSSSRKSLLNFKSTIMTCTCRIVTFIKELSLAKCPLYSFWYCTPDDGNNPHIDDYIFKTQISSGMLGVRSQTLFPDRKIMQLEIIRALVEMFRSYSTVLLLRVSWNISQLTMGKRWSIP